MKLRTSLKTLAASVAVSLVMAGCASQVKQAPALHPDVANSGKVYSKAHQQTDVTHYAVDLSVDPEAKQISGVSEISFIALENTTQITFDLDGRLRISKITLNDDPVEFSQHSAHFTFTANQTLKKGQSYTAKVSYSGSPHVAINPPWDGGIIWSQTESGEPWIATAIQGYGCDVWWPCKDHFLDKPDSVDFYVTLPKGLVAVMNGKLEAMMYFGDKVRYHWKNHSTITAYNIALNIGPYVNNQMMITSVTGREVPLEFWSLKENQPKASKLLQEDIVKQVEFFERVLGPYPWQQDKIGFVETPHLGMEHQSANGYGNGYKRGKHGFDWLLHHELSHEWFGNLITHEKGNDAWIHESFAMYMQPAYAKELLGEAYYQHFMYDAYLNISNCKAVVQDGELSFGEAAHKDIYWKGAWMLHSLRWMIGDELFWRSVREFLYGDQQGQKTFKSTYRNTQDWIDVLHSVTGEDFTWMVNGYLKQAHLPAIQLERKGDQLTVSWHKVDDFPMPIPVQVGAEIIVLDMSKGIATIDVAADQEVLIDPEMKVLRELSIGYTCEESKLKKSRF